MDLACRLEYLALTMVQLPRARHQYISLCAFCQRCTWVAQPGDCGEGIPSCSARGVLLYHTLQGQGADCVLFEPEWLREDCVDAIGMMLRGEHANPVTMRKAGTCH